MPHDVACWCPQVLWVDTTLQGHVKPHSPGQAPKVFAFKDSEGQEHNVTEGRCAAAGHGVRVRCTAVVDTHRVKGV